MPGAPRSTNSNALSASDKCVYPGGLLYQYKVRYSINEDVFSYLQAVDQLSIAHTKLRQAVGHWGRGASQTEPDLSWAAVQAEGQDRNMSAGTNASLPLLSSVMDPGLALERSAAAARVPGSAQVSVAVANWY